MRVHDAGIDVMAWADIEHLGDMPAQPVYDQKKLAIDPSPSAA